MYSVKARLIAVVLTLLLLLHELVASTLGQARVTTIGIAGFRDESGAPASTEAVQSIAGRVQQALNDGYKESLLARSLSAEPDRTPEQLGTLGAQDGVAFVVRGGLLSFNPGSVQLYADVISVGSRTVTTVRAEGASADVEAALAGAVASLSSSIHEAIAASAVAQSTPRSDSTTSTPNGPAITDDQVAESEEELWQLMAQADTLLASPSGISSETLDAIRLALESLKGALEAKAATVADGRDAGDADRVIAASKQQLQSAVSAAAEQTAMIVDTPASYQETGPRKNLLSSLAETLAGATQVLQQIQDLRAAWRAVGDDQSAESGASTEGQQPVEELFENVDGAVTEDGEPVEGVTVTDPESGATTTTDANGSYVLRVVAGKPSRLVLTRNGKEVAAAQLVVRRGRPGIADFELRPRNTSASPRALKVMPSTVLIKPDARRSGPTGTLSGVIRDARGRPQPRALVVLRGVGATRTDAQGRYAFVGAPAGTHQLTASKPGMAPQSARIQIAARTRTQSTISLAANTAQPPSRSTPPIMSRNADNILRGVVTDSNRQPLRGAKVTLMRTTGGVSVLTMANGSYVLRGIEPGEYRTIVAKFGYDTESDSVSVRSGKSETRNVTLKPTTSPAVVAVQKVKPTGAVTSSNPVRRVEPANPGTGRSEPSRPVISRRVTGGLRGEVVDVKTGRPVPGAAISISGARTVQTNQAGEFNFIDLAPGVYPVVVKRNGYADGRGNVTIRGGDTATLTIRLTPRPTIQVRPKTP